MSLYGSNTRMYRLIILAILTATFAKAAERIEIAVCDDTRLPRSVLGHAQQMFEYVMSRSDISVTWTDCAAPSAPLNPRLTIRIRRSPKSVKHAGRSHSLGVSYLETSRQQYAEVFMDEIQNYAAETVASDSSDVLACAMLHEAGHLLGMGHTRRGVMAEKFGETELAALAQNRLRFTEPEAQAMIAAVRRRVMVDSVAMEPPPISDQRSIAKR